MGFVSAEEGQPNLRDHSYLDLTLGATLWGENRFSHVTGFVRLFSSSSSSSSCPPSVYCRPTDTTFHLLTCFLSLHPLSFAGPQGCQPAWA